MNIVITCGPASVPIDEVRRLTNFSTGELGALVAGHCAEAGHRVICLRGEGATVPLPVHQNISVESYMTNDDLLDLLSDVARQARSGPDARIDAVFHCAALSDYQLAGVLTDSGEAIRSAKIASRSGGIVLRLEPAPKVITELRRLFPAAWIVGWKYELEGGREQAILRGRRQIEDGSVDACVVNGRAYGDGFGLLTKTGEAEPGTPLPHVASKAELAALLLARAAAIAG